VTKNSQRPEKAAQGSDPAHTKLSPEEINVLLNELQVYQLELEMQNDELKASYATLDQERAKFVGLYDLAPVGYFILDYLGVVEEANQNGVDLLNMSKQTIIRRRFQSFIAPYSWQDFYNFLHRMQHNDGKQSAEIKLLLPHDQIIYTRMEGIAIPSMMASEIKYYITLIDITESRNAQKVLKETKERLEMTLKASATGTWTIEYDANTVFLDTHSLNIIGIDSWKFEGTITGLIEIVHPEDQSLVKQHLISALNGPKEIDLEFRIVSNNDRVRYIAAKGHKITVLDDKSCFAGILMDITDRKKMEEDAEMLKNGQQKLILSATLTAQEKERNTISRALHDSVCQLLYGIRLNLESVQHKHQLKGEFKNVNELLDQAIKETRQLSYELTPSVLKDFGFVAGVKEMAQRTSSPDFKILAYIDNDADALDPEVQLYIFRMIQEMISNCIKHANASRAEIKVSFVDKQVVIKVADNGTGLKINMDEAGRRGSGLSGIRNRVYLLNGKIRFSSTKKGLTITINLNLTENIP
jgi:PAS domain S-box-containing protein